MQFTIKNMFLLNKLKINNFFSQPHNMFKNACSFRSCRLLTKLILLFYSEGPQ